MKRAFDIAFTLVVAALGLPFYMLIAALIKLTSEGPVLFVQERVGRDGGTFRFYKFRTMLVDNNDHQHRSFAEDFIKGRLMNDAEEGRVFKLQNDPRYFDRAFSARPARRAAAVHQCPAR
jgi:lipopolysaccharide/colanic/teichoic acid biosynthesis glycosyltransferase